MRISEFKRTLKERKFCHRMEMLISFEDLDIFSSSEDRRIKLVKDNRSVEIDGIWNIQPISISKSQVAIVCPYCCEIHFHGGGAYEGFRLPHCKNHLPLPSYKIVKLKKS